MKIGRMNERITFQKNTVRVDAYRNHTNTWTDYYSCAAYASTYTANENGEVVTSEERSIAFEVRYCPELKNINSTNYRVVFHDEVFNILSVDMMNYQKKEIRLTCRKEKR